MWEINNIATDIKPVHKKSFGKHGYKILILLVVMLSACAKPYNPTVIASANNYLVVEGVINTGQDSTIIKLSRTVNVNSKTTSKVETGATVKVESSTNEVYTLTPGTLIKGTYAAPALNLDNSKKYRLHIVTSDRKDYVSDFVQAQVTPPIDSVSWKVVNNTVQLYANTHDPNNNTRYYRFDYQETWEFHAMYESGLMVKNGALVPRNLLTSDNIYNCWGNNASKIIILGSTAKLSQDVLSQLPLTYVNSTEEKLESRYSILVKEYALSKEAYTFWTNLKRITEQLGSIFDAQPSALPGNIHCITTPDEPVLGYISAASVSSKRIYITKSQLPDEWRTVYPYDCLPDTLLLAKKSGSGVINQEIPVFFTGPPSEVPISEYILPGALTPIGHIAGTYVCADCTVRGVNKKPSYWP